MSMLPNLCVSKSFLTSFVLVSCELRTRRHIYPQLSSVVSGQDVSNIWACTLLLSCSSFHMSPYTHRKGQRQKKKKRLASKGTDWQSFPLIAFQRRQNKKWNGLTRGQEIRKGNEARTGLEIEKRSKQWPNLLITIVNCENVGSIVFNLWAHIVQVHTFVGWLAWMLRQYFGQHGLIFIFLKIHAKSRQDFFPCVFIYSLFLIQTKRQYSRDNSLCRSRIRFQCVLPAQQGKPNLTSLVYVSGRTLAQHILQACAGLIEMNETMQEHDLCVTPLTF